MVIVKIRVETGSVGHSIGLVSPEGEIKVSPLCHSRSGVGSSGDGKVGVF